MAAPTAARLTRWAEGHHPDQTKLTDTTKPKGPVSLIVARLRRFNRSAKPDVLHLLLAWGGE